MAIWLTASFVFYEGQLMFDVAVAMISATFIGDKLVKSYNKPKWLAVVLWPILVVAGFQAIMYWAIFMNWTLWYMPATQAWPLVRILDMAIISVAIGLIGIVWQKWLRSKITEVQVDL